MFSLSSLALVEPAAGEVLLFDNGMPAISNEGGAWAAADGWRLFDNFTIAQDGTEITRITIEALEAGNTSYTDTTFTFFDAAPAPSSLIATIADITYSTRTANGLTNGGWTGYTYSYDVTLILDAGTYWLGLQHDGASVATSATTTAGPDSIAPAMQRLTAGASFTESGPDLQSDQNLAFSLFGEEQVPVPAAALLLVAGMAGIAARWVIRA